MAKKRNVLIPFIDSDDINRIIDSLPGLRTEDKRYILLRLLDHEQSRLLSKRMEKDFHLLMAELEDDGWKSLYFFQEEFKSLDVNVRIVLRSGNILKEIHGFLKEYNIDTVLFARSYKTGLSGKIKSDMINDMLLSSEKMVIIV